MHITCFNLEDMNLIPNNTTDIRKGTLMYQSQTKNQATFCKEITKIMLRKLISGSNKILLSTIMSLFWQREENFSFNLKIK